MKFLQTPEMRLHDDRKIEVVLAEFEAGIVDDIAWVKALKSAKGNESYAKALYFDERIKRIEDHWHTQQKRLLDDADFKLAEQLASLSKEMDEVKDRTRLFEKRSVTVMGSLCIASVTLFVYEQIQLAFYTLVILVFFFILFIIKEIGLDNKKTRINDQIKSIDKVSKTSNSVSKILIILVTVFSAWVVFSYIL